MTQIFFREIDKLKAQLLAQFERVEKAVELACRSLIQLNPLLAEEVFRAENLIDEHEIDLQEECFKIIALHQPVALDLRFIVAVLKFNNDLERISDLAVNIAERAQALKELPRIDPPYDFAVMAKEVQGILRSAFEALVHLNVSLARHIMAGDDAVDQRHAANFRRVIENIQAQPQQVETLLHYLGGSRYLERIADLATNLAEEVVYIARGEIVRHQYPHQMQTDA
ncbi:phosphate signaling complex protein PhoU [Geoalkalibacter sp.]|uniref:phosphate signaling complex protein PhoU n=1 Tax=Geoalkalibacter sp. TaxID=3041440 RepID=UPI00272E3706|nr:phosphate signaling complex protein PhoU [Geoalkalibacter sp.]